MSIEWPEGTALGYPTDEVEIGDATVSIVIHVASPGTVADAITEASRVLVRNGINELFVSVVDDALGQRYLVADDIAVDVATIPTNDDEDLDEPDDNGLLGDTGADTDE